MNGAAPISQGHQIGKLILFLLPFAIAIIVVKFNWPSPTAAPSVPSTPALATAKFSGGETFELLRAELSDQLEIDFPKAPRSFTGGGGGTSSRGIPEFSIVTEKENGQVVKGALQFDAPGLMLEVKLTDYYGDSMSSDVILSPRRPDGWIAIGRDGDGFVEGIDGQRGPAPSFEYCKIEVADGAGGWLPVGTPVVIQERDGRGLTICQVFSRTTPDLQLRVTVEDEQKTLTFPNPGYSSTTAAWTADPEPWKRNLGDCAIEFVNKGLTGGGGNVPDMRLEITGLGGQPDNAFRSSITEVADESGNAAEDARGFTLLPGTKHLRYSGYVSRTEKYVWPEADVEFLAEVTWNGTTSEATLKTLPEGRKVGISQLEMKENSTDKWEFTIQMFHRTTPTNPAPERLAVFFEGEKESNGDARRMGASSGGGRSQASYFWNGKMTDGQKFKLGRILKPTETPFEFTIPVAP